MIAALPSPAAVVVPGPRFARLPAGWQVLAGAAPVLTRRGANASAVALSWAPRPGRGWAESMPRDGIAVTVLLIRRQVGVGPAPNLCRVTPHLAAYPLVRRLPLRLPARTGATLDGTPGVPEYRVFGRIGESYEVEVRVDVAAPHPRPALLALARRVVAAIVFPRWPNRARC